MASHEAEDNISSGKESYIAVVAIDFGTTFSGFAFAFNHQEGETGIHMNKDWGTDQGYSMLKTPTSLLLNPDKSFNSFGFEAQDRFAELEDEQAQEFYYFQHFKMMLHNSEAGLGSSSNPDQVLITLEPEAASVYCRERKMRDFISETGNDDTLMANTLACSESAQYVVIDSGGGTLDVTVHQLLKKGAIKEIYKATGGPFGGQRVNYQFRILLESIFTEKFIEDYSTKNPIDWLYLITDFEVKKRGKRVFEGGTTRVRLPNSFVSRFPTSKGWDINCVIQEHYSLDEIKVQRNEFLCLGPDIMRQLFEPVLGGITTHISNLLVHEALSKIKFIFLVGGFAESILLQERMTKHFGDSYRIMVPHYASLAVVQGAVMFGQKPDIFESRIMTATYGIRVHKLFLDGVHPESKREVIGGISRCKDVFLKFVKVNEVVKLGETRHFSGLEPVSGFQKEIVIEFYQTDREDVEFVTDSGVEKAPGRGLVLGTPEAWKTKDIEIDLLFGGTEIKVTAVNRTSNKHATGCIDFLAAGK